MINDEMNTLLKQSKLYVDVIEVDAKSTITDNLNIVHDRPKMLNKHIKTTTNNEEMINMLKLIKTRIDLNSKQLTELKNTLV